MDMSLVSPNLIDLDHDPVATVKSVADFTSSETAALLEDGIISAEKSSRLWFWTGPTDEGLEEDFEENISERPEL